jgi:DNA-binding transcriptional regulator LsrR (DeoR family)
MAKIKDRRDLLVKVARQYYDEQRTKANIAADLGVSATYVALLLKEAVDKHIVEIRIQPPPDLAEPLDALVRDKFGLKEVIIVEGGKYLQVCENVGAAAANYFDRNVQNGSQIAISGGTSILRMIERIKHPKLLTIFPTAIASRGPLITHADSYALVTNLIFKSEATSQAHGILCPPASKSHTFKKDNVIAAIQQLESERQELLQANEHIAGLYEEMERTDYDFIFLACGPVRTMYNTETLLTSLEARGLSRLTIESVDIVANVNYWLVDATLTHRLTPFIAIKLEKFQSQVKNGRKVVLVAGSTFKVTPIWIHLVHKLCNVLITDRETALELLKLPSEPPKTVNVAARRSRDTL